MKFNDKMVRENYISDCFVQSAGNLRTGLQIKNTIIVQLQVVLSCIIKIKRARTLVD